MESGDFVGTSDGVWLGAMLGTSVGLVLGEDEVGATLGLPVELP